MLVRRNFGSSHHFWLEPAPQGSYMPGYKQRYAIEVAGGIHTTHQHVSSPLADALLSLWTCGQLSAIGLQTLANALYAKAFATRVLFFLQQLALSGSILKIAIET